MRMQSEPMEYVDTGTADSLEDEVLTDTDPANVLEMAVSVGREFANVYVEEHFPEVERSVLMVYFLSEGKAYKHFTFVLSKGKTRVGLTDLGPGRYLCRAVQFSKEGEIVKGAIEFDMEPFLQVDTGLELKRIERAIRTLGEKFERWQ